MKKFLSLIMALTLLTTAVNAIELAPNQRVMGHYTTDDIALGGCWGRSFLREIVAPIATDLTPDELAMFQGSKIVAFRVGMSTAAPVTRVFLMPVSPSGQLGEVTEWPCNVAAAGWNVIELDEPYLVNLPGDYSLRIGFDYEQLSTSDKPISAVKVGTIYPTYHYLSGKWTSYGVNTTGNLSLQCIAQNDNFPKFIVRATGLSCAGGIIIGEGMDYSFVAYNLGAEDIAAGNCLFNVAIDGNIVATIANPEAITGDKKTFNFTLPTAELTEGAHTLTVTIASINGEAVENGVTLSRDFKAFITGYARQMRLIEQFTSTYCTYCPMGSANIAQLCELRDDIAWVGVHQNMSGTDPFRTVQCDSIANYQGCDGYPEGSFDRATGFSSASSVCNVLTGAPAANISSFLDYIQDIPASSTININSTVDEGRKASIVVSGNILPGSTDRLTVYITEDNLVARQLNSGTWVEDYVHNGVLRTAVGGVKGVAINATGNTYRNEFTVDIPEAWDLDNLNVVAFISRPMGGALTDLRVDQANKRKLGEADAAVRGDVDGDGKVTIDDVTSIIDCLLGGTQPANPAGADCYPDGNLTIDDVTMLIDYLLSGVWTD